MTTPTIVTTKQPVTTWGVENTPANVITDTQGTESRARISMNVKRTRMTAMITLSALIPREDSRANVIKDTRETERNVIM